MVLLLVGIRRLMICNHCLPFPYDALFCSVLCQRCKLLLEQQLQVFKQAIYLGLRDSSFLLVGSEVDVVGTMRLMSLMLGDSSS